MTMGVRYCAYDLRLDSGRPELFDDRRTHLVGRLAKW